MAFSKYPTWVYGAAGLLLGLLAVGVYSYWQDYQLVPAPEDYHVHADFALYINEEKFDFAQEKYMENNGHALSKIVHFHDLDGEVIHIHKPNIQLGHFLDAIGMKLEGNCFITDANQNYCTNQTEELRVFVNGILKLEPESYVMQDLDRIMVAYGPINADVTNQLASVSDRACIQSELCPERGSPRPEGSCSVSGGCAVDYIPVGE